jgi:aminoglycoside phosphotransferase (APT) family kinase protein
MQVPRAEHEVTSEVVRQLLADQHADLASRPIEFLAEGFDTTLWHLGDDLLVRLPRRAEAEEGMRNEQRWLGTIAPLLPLPISAPVRVGQPGAVFPFVWSVVPYLQGDPLLGGPALDGARAAPTLGRFLRALHVDAPPDAPTSHLRGTPIEARHPTFAERVGALDHSDARAATTVWDEARDAAVHGGPSCWVHGDLHAGNVLAAHGDVVGVLDFIDLNAGDPATDLASVWLLLEDDAVTVALEAYGGADDDLRARARGWAVLFSVFFVSLGRGGREDYGTEGERMLRRVLASR